MEQKIELPVDKFGTEIIETVKKNPFTILIAETGAGKSTRVPFMLMMGLGKPVIVTQPRRLATEALATRVAEENGLFLGDLIGFRTAVTKKDSDDSMCVYVTDGLHLVRELTESKSSLKNGIILVIDEVHEFNENIETLLAWCDQLIKEKVDLRVVIMSATMEHKSLSQYFNNAPVIHIPGQNFQVSGAPSNSFGPHQVAEEELIMEIQKSISHGKNTLVFLPGKKEIFGLSEELTALNLNAEIIHLQGELGFGEQKRAFDTYEKPKLILATNIAQTSITIPDIDSIIDSGCERKIELWNGVETLVKKCISKADCKQRAGRAGRTKKGTYVLCNNTPYEKFSEYPTPEICQKRLDQTVLRLATAGFDATELRFFHQPDISVLNESKKILIDMEALGADGAVTELGFQINRFPTSIIVARMIIEAIKRKCLTRILDFAAILSNNRSSIKLQPNKYQEYPPHFKMWDQIIPKDKHYQSDLLTEFELWDIAYKDLDCLETSGVDRKSYLESVDIRKQLKTIVFRIGYNAGSDYNENATDDIEVLKCVTAGMIHNVYRHLKEGRYAGRDTRRLYKDSLIHRNGYPQLIVGVPINLPMKDTSYSPDAVARVLINCTAIEVSWLEEIAPQIVKKVTMPSTWKQESLMLTIDTITLFNEVEVHRTSIPAPWSEDNVVILSETVSRIFLPRDNQVVSWIYKMRYDFVQEGLGTITDFSEEFAEAIRKYKTLLVTELTIHKKDIRAYVFSSLTKLKRKYAK